MSAMAQGSGDWFRRQFTASFDEQADRIGRFNLAIFGKTGVGKSTLINAIFGEDLAETGIGEPVTKDSHLYMHHSGHFGVLDTRGLEIGQDNEVILDDLKSYVRKMRRIDMIARTTVKGMTRQKAVFFGDERLSR